MTVNKILFENFALRATKRKVDSYGHNMKHFVFHFLVISNKTIVNYI